MPEVASIFQYDLLNPGQIWRSSRVEWMWWRIVMLDAGKVVVEGPRGCIRSSLDGGKTWSELGTFMTRSGFAAWVKKHDAVLAGPQRPSKVPARLTALASPTNEAE